MRTIIISTVDEVVTGMHKTTTLNVIVSHVFDVTMLTFQMTFLMN